MIYSCSSFSDWAVSITIIIFASGGVDINQVVIIKFIIYNSTPWSNNKAVLKLDLWFYALKTKNDVIGIEVKGKYQIKKV